MRSLHCHTILAISFALSVSVVAIELAANVALGAEISITMGGTDSSSSAPTPGASPTLTSRMSILTLPPLQPDDIDRVLNYQPGDPPSYAATIRAENAADFGLDWQAFQDTLIGRGALVTLRFGSARPSDSPLVNPLFFTDFTMDEIRVAVDYYFWHPVLPGLRATRVRFEIDGSGNVAPEPSSAVLFVIGLGLLHVRTAGRRQRPC